MVVVDVVAIDKKGSPVMDLKAEEYDVDCLVAYLNRREWRDPEVRDAMIELWCADVWACWQTSRDQIVEVARKYLEVP